MTRLIVLTILFLQVVIAASYTSLDRADRWLATKKTKSVLKAYHEYKNIRINSIMQSSTSLQIKPLEGIIQSGKWLHIDTTKYRLELQKLTGKKIIESKKTEKRVATPRVNRLKSARWRHGMIIMSFDHLVKESQVKYFVLDKKFSQRNRYIFDIQANANKRIKLSKSNLDALRLNTSIKGKVRLVLESRKSLPIRYSRRGKDLIISLGKKRPLKDLSSVKIVQKVKYEKRRKQRIIVIDPGHGGKDPGAVGYKKYREKIIVFQIARKLSKELKALGYKVYMTRTRDTYIPLRKRTSLANKKGADLFISIHANSVPRRRGYQKHYGLETYFLSPAKGKRAKNVAAIENSKEISDMNYFSKENFLSLLNNQKILASNKLAIDIQRGMLSQLRKKYNGIKDAGVRKGPFWVLVGAQMPSVLVEVGFVTSPLDAKRLVSKTYQYHLAHGLALGVENYFKYNP